MTDKRDVPPLLAFTADQRRQHRPLEHDPIARLAANLEALDPVRHPWRPGAGRCGFPGRRRLREDHPYQLALELGGARHDRDQAGRHRELTGIVGAGAQRVSEVVEAIDQLTFGHRLAAAELERTGEDAGEYTIPLAVQAGVDQPREADVVVDAGERGDQGGNGERNRQNAHPLAAPDLRDPNRQL